MFNEFFFKTRDEKIINSRLRNWRAGNEIDKNAAQVWHCRREEYRLASILGTFSERTFRKSKINIPISNTFWWIIDRRKLKDARFEVLQDMEKM